MSLLFYLFFLYINNQDKDRTLPAVLSLIIYPVIYLACSRWSIDYFIPVFYFSLFCFFAGWQDLKTFYIDNYWFLLFLPFLLIFPLFKIHFASGLFFFLLGFFFVKGKLMGKADPWFLGLFGLLIGYKRMLFVLLSASLTGILYFLIKKERIIPFLPFLCFWAWSVFLLN